MFKQKIKIILIIVLIIQLITPFTFLIYQNNINKHLDNPTDLIKLNINAISISYEDTIFIDFDISEIHKIDNYYKYNYIVFEPSINNEYSKIQLTNHLPKNNNYIYYDNYYDLFHYVSEETFGIYEKHGHLNLYDKYNELDNITYGYYYEGGLTEAYALVSIYKNQFKINEIYIDGYSLQEYITLYESNEINLKRYDNYDSRFIFTNDDYLKIIPEDKRNLYYLVLGD